MQKLIKNPMTFAVAMSIAATAQMPVAWSQDDELDLEEVIVTARKREENLQEVPLSVTAVTDSGTSWRFSSRFLAVTMTSSRSNSSSCDQATGICAVAAMDIATAKVIGFLISFCMGKAPRLFLGARPLSPKKGF